MEVVISLQDCCTVFQNNDDGDNLDRKVPDKTAPLESKLKMMQKNENNISAGNSSKN